MKASAELKAIGVIPARYGSTRFSGKPLALIAGKPLLQHVIEGARKAKLLSEIIVATDDERIVSVAKNSGARAVMTDPELPSGTDRVWAAITSLSAPSAAESYDVVVNIQGDEPLIEGEPLDALVDAFRLRPHIEMATLGRELDLMSSDGLSALMAETTAKIVVDATDRALYFSRFPIPFSRVKPESLSIGSSAVLKHVGIYAYRPAFLQKFCATPPAEIEIFEGLEQLRALVLGASIHVVRTEHDSWGVDTPEDVEKIEIRLRHRGSI